MQGSNVIRAVPLISIRVTDAQRILLEKITKELDSVSATVRDLIEKEAERRGITLDSPDTLGIPSAETGLPLNLTSTSKAYIFNKIELEGLLAAMPDDGLRVGWKELFKEWWQVRKETHRSKVAQTKRACKTSLDALFAAKHIYGEAKAYALLEAATTNAWKGIQTAWAENVKVQKSLAEVTEERQGPQALNLDPQEKLVYNWYNSLTPGDQKSSIDRAIANPEENEAEFVVFQKMGLIK